MALTKSNLSPYLDEGVTMRKFFVTLGLLTVFCAQSHPATALAQEGVQYDAEEGAWIALHHSPDGGIKTDVCTAGNLVDGVSVRASSKSLEVRFGDKEWNLPPDTKGVVTVKTNNYEHKFDTVFESSTMLGAFIAPEDMKSLIAALAQSSGATISFGGKTPREISLSGSMAALKAFQNCVEMAGLADLGNATAPTKTPF